MAFAAIAPGQVPESLERWSYYKEIATPGQAAGLLDIVLDVAVLDKARQDHADLRLYNQAGKEIPYALRIRREVHTSDAFEAREFNRSRRGSVAEVSFDLGRQAREHNELEIETQGQNFRRRVDVEGSRDGSQWSELVSAALIYRFAGTQGSVDERSVTYPVSRYPLLRVRVHADPQVDNGAPRIKSVTIRRSVRLEGQILEFPAVLKGREATRQGGRPASAYRFDLGGRIPLQSVVVSAGDESFSRPYLLEAVDEDYAQPIHLASGRLLRRTNEKPLDGTKISFQERFVRRLRLTVTDDRNAPLTIVGLSGQSAARQFIFDAQLAGQGPVKLYYGNAEATAPHYDFAVALPQRLPSPPVRLALGRQQDNPIYRPEQKPLSERSPWLIYLVLGLASLTLFLVLRNLTGAIAGRDS